MANKTAKQAFDEERANILAITEFEYEFSDRLKFLIKAALRYVSIIKIGCPDATYKNMIYFERPFRMSEALIVIKVLTGATPAEMSMKTEEWWENLEEHVFPMREVWRDIDESLSDKIMVSVNARLKITQGVPDSKQLFIPG